MKLWMSSEEMFDVGDAMHSIRNHFIEPTINELLTKIEVKEDYEQWALITILMPLNRIQDYPEIVRRSLKRKVLEFRLQIDHATFKVANQQGQIKLVLDTLDRSIDLMTKLKVSQETQTKLKAVVSEARQQLLTE